MPASGQPGPLDAIIGKRIRKRRKFMGMSQSDLAEPIGIRFQQINKYECGACKVAAVRLFEISLILDVPITYFYAELPKEQAFHART